MTIFLSLWPDYLLLFTNQMTRDRASNQLTHTIRAEFKKVRGSFQTWYVYLISESLRAGDFESGLFHGSTDKQLWSKTISLWQPWVISLPAQIIIVLFKAVIACITPIIKSKAEIKAAIIYFRGKITTLSRMRWPLSHYYGILCAFAVRKWDWCVYAA